MKVAQFPTEVTAHISHAKAEGIKLRKETAWPINIAWQTVAITLNRTV
jgi:hypothetical protein